MAWKRIFEEIELLKEFKSKKLAGFRIWFRIVDFWFGGNPLDWLILKSYFQFEANGFLFDNYLFIFVFLYVTIPPTGIEKATTTSGCWIINSIKTVSHSHQILRMYPPFRTIYFSCPVCLLLLIMLIAGRLRRYIDKSLLLFIQLFMLFMLSCSLFAINAKSRGYL